MKNSGQFKKLYIFTDSSELRLGIFALILFIIIIGSSLLFKTQSQRAQIVTKTILPTYILHGDTSKKQIILTFDAGEGIQSAEKVLEILAKYNIKGTFFVTGKFIEKNSDLVRRIVEQGHEVFNHTYSHPYLTSVSSFDIARELNMTDDLLIRITGSTTRPFFRPPYGDEDKRVLDVAARDGYKGVGWTVDALDWEEQKGMTADQVRKRIYSTLAPGNIYLMHLGDNITMSVLDDAIAYIEKSGYIVVSLTQGL